MTNGYAALERETPQPLSRPEPTTLEETGLREDFVIDLVVKALHARNRASPLELSELFLLPPTLLYRLLEQMRDDRLTEPAGGAAAITELQRLYALTELGVRRANVAIERSPYVGPAPIAYKDYVALQYEQTEWEITPQDIRAALVGLVLEDSVLTPIGAAARSRRSILLFGPSGNGKSSITAALGRLYPNGCLIPHAVEIEGHVVEVFDPRIHRPIRDARARPAESGFGAKRVDRRLVWCETPVVSLGGELRLEDLAPVRRPGAGSFVAPPQMKANGGVLVIDDFGRQEVRPEALLNRWIVPMETGVDQFSLGSSTVRMPFNVMLTFSTNLEPSDLGDEAFLRRIPYKVEVPPPTREGFVRVVRGVCSEYGLPFDPQAAEYLAMLIESVPGSQGLRASQPRDILRNLVDLANYEGETPRLEPRQLIGACRSYFGAEFEVREAEILRPARFA